MKPLTLIISLLLLLVSARTASAYDPVKGIPPRQLKVAGITINDSEVAIEKAFGHKKSTDCEEPSPFCSKECRATYEGAEVIYCDGKAVNVKCRSPKFRTPTGVRVGLSVAEVQRLQGQAVLTSVGGDECLSYNVAKRDCALIIHFAGGKVIEIELWLDFT